MGNGGGGGPVCGGDGWRLLGLEGSRVNNVAPTGGASDAGAAD